MITQSVSGESAYSIELSKSYVPGIYSVQILNEDLACISSSIVYDVRIQLSIEVGVKSGYQKVAELVNVSSRVENPICPGKKRTAFIPVPFSQGVIRTVSIVRTEPRSENVVSIIANKQTNIPFAHNLFSRGIAFIGLWRILVLIVAGSVVFLALRVTDSKRSAVFFWIIIIVIILMARWRMLTIIPRPDRDPAFNLHEAMVVYRTGMHAPLDEQIRPGYMMGFHYLLAVLLLLTGIPWGVLLIPICSIFVIISIVHRIGLPSRTAQLAVLLLGTQTYHIAMTSMSITTMMTLTLAGVAVMVLLVSNNIITSAVVLSLFALCIGLSHSGGFAYVTLALSSTAVWLFFTNRDRMVGIGISLIAAASICLSVIIQDQYLYTPALILGAIILAASRIRIMFSPRYLRWGVYFLSALLVITLNTGVGIYWKSRMLGGLALGLFTMVGFVSYRISSSPLELPFLLALPHAFWSFSSIPFLGYVLDTTFRMRIFLSSVLGIALVAGRGFDVLLERITYETGMRRRLLTIIVICLFASHLDRILFLGADEVRLGMPAYWSMPRHPPDDLRKVVAFIESRTENSIIIYDSCDYFFEAINKSIIRRGFRIPPLNSTELTLFCSSDNPPLIIVDKYYRQYSAGAEEGMMEALDGSCYKKVYSNPTFRAYAALV